MPFSSSDPPSNVAVPCMACRTELFQVMPRHSQVKCKRSDNAQERHLDNRSHTAGGKEIVLSVLGWNAGTSQRVFNDKSAA